MLKTTVVTETGFTGDYSFLNLEMETAIRLASIFLPLEKLHFMQVMLRILQLHLSGNLLDHMRHLESTP